MERCVCFFRYHRTHVLSFEVDNYRKQTLVRLNCRRSDGAFFYLSPGTFRWLLIRRLYPHILLGPLFAWKEAGCVHTPISCSISNEVVLLIVLSKLHLSYFGIGTFHTSQIYLVFISEYFQAVTSVSTDEHR